MENKNYVAHVCNLKFKKDTIQIIHKNRQTGRNYHLNEVKRLLSNQKLFREIPCKYRKQRDPFP